MKKYLKYSVLSVVFLSMTACQEEFLEFVPEDQSTVGGWYRNADEIRQATAGLYGGTWWGYTDQLQWLSGDLLSGDIIYNFDQEGQYFFNSYNSTNRHLETGWRGLYDVVTNSNLIIDDMPSVAAGYGVSEEVINEGLGEARFFRGATYYLLAEHWGAVPILENPAAKISAQELQLPRNTVEDVYEFARRDLAFAADNLPTSDDPGRVTSWSAKGMLAKLHVTMGHRFGDPAEFTTAAAYASDVINNSGLSLASSYEDLFKFENEHDPEVLWAIENVANGWGTGSSRMTRWGRSVETTGGNAWGGGISMTINYQENVESNAEGLIDERRRAIYMQNGDFYDYLNVANGGYTYEIVVRDEANEVVNGYNNGLSNLKKHVVGNDADLGGVLVTNQDSPFNIYMLRLADVYLLLAEAELGAGASISGGPGYQAYLDVRARAGLNPPADGDMTYEDLFNERRVELGLEAQTWFSIKRWYYKSPAQALNFLNNQARSLRYITVLDGDQTNDINDYELVYSPNDETNPPCAPDCFDDMPEVMGPESTNGSTHNESVNMFTDSNMSLPLPNVELNANPKLGEEPVPYFNE